MASQISNSPIDTEIDSLFGTAWQVLPMPQEMSSEQKIQFIYSSLLNAARKGTTSLISSFTEMSSGNRDRILSSRRKASRRGASTNDFEQEGFTVLHVAVLFEQLGVVKLLLPGHNDKYKLLMVRTVDHELLALHLCAVHGGSETLQYLLEAYSKEHTRVSQGGESNLRRFRDKFHDVHMMTPLHFATWLSNLKMVELLVSKRYLGTITYVQSVDFFLQTPLHINTLILIPPATTDDPRDGFVRKPRDASAITKLLIGALHDQGLPDLINAVDCCSYTPLHWAVQSPTTGITKFLLEDKNINPVERDREGKTPLHLAIKNSRRRRGSYKGALSRSLFRSGNKELLLSKKAVIQDMEKWRMEWQFYVNAPTATLVGASLIANVTFIGLLQSPFGWVNYYSSTYEDSPSDADGVYGAALKDALVERFWAFNGMAFVLAVVNILFISTFLTTPAGTPNLDDIHMQDLAEYTKKWVLLTSYMFSLTIILVLLAFIMAGLAALPPPMLSNLTTFLHPLIVPAVGSLLFFSYLFIRYFIQSTRGCADWGKFCVETPVRESFSTRQKNTSLASLLASMSRCSTADQVSECWQEIEEKNLLYHPNQTPGDCRQEAINVGGKAARQLKEFLQTHAQEDLGV